MPNQTTSFAIVSEADTQSPEIDQMIDEFRSIWCAHQVKGIEIRHQIGKRLNKELGSPSKRQEYAVAVVKRVAEELGVNETNICRFRRFAERFPTYDEFCEKHPDVTSWTGVRNLITESRKSVSGGRKSWALVRSLRSTVESLKSPEPLDSSRAEEINQLLQELFDVACRHDEIRLSKHSEFNLSTCE